MIGKHRDKKMPIRSIVIVVSHRSESKIGFHAAEGILDIPNSVV